jgi:hypothetical protein
MNMLAFSMLAGRKRERKRRWIVALSGREK